MKSAADDLQKDGDRVCGQCMSRKTKCSRQRPTCSRCAENGWECLYSATKRKPGPAKGSGTKHRRITVPDTDDARDITFGASRHLVGTAEPMDDRSSTLSSPHMPPGSVDIKSSFQGPSSSWKSYRMVDAQSDGVSDPLSNGFLNLSPGAESDLLNVFFETIQPLYPLFRKSDLFWRYYVGQMPQNMLSAIFAVSATRSATQEVLTYGANKVGEAYASLAWQDCSAILSSNAPATINDLKTIFLLSLYEFRKSPSQKAWTTIGHLVRLSYTYGLHQIDNPTNCSFYEPGVTSSADLEDWRYLWWSIYMLDTWCNAIAATPSSIDLDSLCTALPTGTVEDWTNGTETPATTRHFLSNDIEQLSHSLRRISSNWQSSGKDFLEVDVAFAIRIINTLQTREALDLRRAANQNPKRNFGQRWQVLSTQLAVTRLALPPRYLDPLPDVASGERKHFHALRLLNLLEIILTNLLVSIPKTSGQVVSEGDWLREWESSMGNVNQIVMVIRNWDPQMCYLTDPCTSYIVYVAMIVLHVDSKLENDRKRPAVQEDATRSSWQLLKLFLEQLSNDWLLPKTLITAAENFRKTASSPMTPQDASQLLQHLLKPLRFRPQLDSASKDMILDYDTDNLIGAGLGDISNWSDVPNPDT